MTTTDRPAPSQIRLPEWVEYLRPQQVTAIQHILDDYDAGKKVVFLEAPTGSGKTLIAEMVRQNLGCRGLYLCSTISLQSQYMRDFPSAALLMGRSNYPTLDHPASYDYSGLAHLSCADCVKRKVSGEWQCKWCHPVEDCPYERAKFDALISAQTCTNTYYFLNEANYIGRLAGRGLVIIDECDTLESILMSVIEVSFSRRALESYNLPVPSKKTVEESWLEWAEEAFGLMVKFQTSLHEPTLTSTVEQIKEWNRVDRAVHDLARLIDSETGIATGGWVYTGYNEGDVQFKPVKVDRFGHDYLWRHGAKFLLMSATIISSDEMAESLGLNREEVVYADK